MENYPKNPKCCYQFGQRIVGWSRIAQHVAMQLVHPHTESIICGDTDSFKIYANKDNIQDIDDALSNVAKAIDESKERVCNRVKRNFPNHHDELDSIGHYICEGEYDKFSASWNKSYIGMQDGRLHMTLAGVPTSRGDHSIENLGENLLANGADFASVASLLIGYNVTFDYSLTKLNGRKHPQWGMYYDGEVTDYLGNTSHVFEPMALALYPEPKTIGNTDMKENADNLLSAIENNTQVNANPVLLRWVDDMEVIE